MAAQRNIYRNMYVNGSAAPELPAYEPEKIRKAKREYVQSARLQIEERVNEKRRAARYAGVRHALAVTVSLAVIIGLAGLYIVELSAHRKALLSVETLEKEYQTVHDEVILEENRISREIDYNAVYEYAVNELGMTVPMKNQIIYYSQEPSEYVLAAGEIPNE